MPDKAKKQNQLNLDPCPPYPSKHPERHKKLMKFLNDLDDKRFEKELLVLVLLLVSNLTLIVALMYKCGSFGGITSIQADIERIKGNNKITGTKTTVVDWSAFAKAAEDYKVAKIYMVGSSCSFKGCNSGTIVFTSKNGNQAIVEETRLYEEKLIEFSSKYGIKIYEEGELTYKSSRLFCEV